MGYARQEWLFEELERGWAGDQRMQRLVRAIADCPWEMIRPYFPVNYGPGAKPKDREELWHLYVAGAVEKKFGASEAYRLLEDKRIRKLVGYGPGETVASRRTYARFVQLVGRTPQAANLLLKSMSVEMEDYVEDFGENVSLDPSALRVVKPTEEAEKKEKQKEIRCTDTAAGLFLQGVLSLALGKLAKARQEQAEAGKLAG